MARQSAPNARAEIAAAVYLPLDELRPNPRNPRLHGAEVERLARTILRTTWGAPIIAQRSTLRIIGGHGRLEAARRIMDGVEIDGILRGGPEHRFDRDAPGAGVVPVRLVDVSDAEADAMTLADNARALQGTDDAAAVVAMATHAFARDAAVMADIGFDGAALDALVKAAGDAVLARNNSTDFLDEFGAPSEESPTDAEGAGPSSPFKTLLLTMSPEDNDTVIAALRAIQRANDLPSRDAALVHLARAYMEEHPE